MVIKNFTHLAHSPFRKQLLSIAEAGFQAISTQAAIESSVLVKAGILHIKKHKINLKNYKRVFVLCFGKAALSSSKAIKKILGNFEYKGFVIDVSVPEDFNEGAWVFKRATHPQVSRQNVLATKAVLDEMAELNENDLVICLTSGGGSAIFELPFSGGAETEARVFKALTKAGAGIGELNTVRKHMSLVKGGGLAKIFFPAKIFNLIFSDVPGDDLSVIASGPLIIDNTTVRDAEAILKKYEVLNTLELPSLPLIETPKEEKYFENIENEILLSAQNALLAMKERAEILGYKVRIFSRQYQGEARILARQIFAAGKNGQCLLGAGESTVKILGQGKGGRNQEMALAALAFVGHNQVLGCFASDGHDFTDCAGAIADISTLERSRNLKLDYKKYLDNNDSHTFFEQVGDHVITGLTGSNVADFFILLN